MYIISKVARGNGECRLAVLELKDKDTILQRGRGRGRGLTPVKVERTSRVKDNLETRRLGHLIKGILLGDIRHNDNLKSVCLGRVCLTNLLRLVLRADRRNNSVSLSQELLQYVGCDSFSLVQVPQEVMSLFALGLHTSNEARTA